jgi:hypothetical protein
VIRRLLFVAVLSSTMVRSTSAQTTPCKSATMVSECPTIGCAAPGTPEAEANTLRKHHPPTTGAIHRLGIPEFERLQIAANRLGLQGFAIAYGERSEYQKLGEGQRVEFTGFIVGMPHARRTDSANCRLIGRDNNSFRLNLAELPDDTEFDSILAEVIPQKRPLGWTLPKLRYLARTKRRVRVVGQLFYDSKHVVNSDPDDEQPGQPKRLSLWEIHPVSEISVCRFCYVSQCDPKRQNDWFPLERVPDPDLTRIESDFEDCP